MKESEIVKGARVRLRAWGGYHYALIEDVVPSLYDGSTLVIINIPALDKSISVLPEELQQIKRPKRK